MIASSEAPAPTSLHPCIDSSSTGRGAGTGNFVVLLPYRFYMRSCAVHTPQCSYNQHLLPPTSGKQELIPHRRSYPSALNSASYADGILIQAATRALLHVKSCSGVDDNLSRGCCTGHNSYARTKNFPFNRYHTTSFLKPITVLGNPHDF